MTAVLGVSAYYHDSAAAVVVDGEVVAAAQEERFTRVKHDHRLPLNAIEYCLEEAGVTADQLDYVAFYDKPFLKFDRLLETYVAYAPVGVRSYLKAMPLWLKEKLHVSRELGRALGGQYKKRFVFAEHHESHAASAFFPSPFEEAAILTLDGVGEWATASVGRGQGNRIELEAEMRFPHSLGLLYSAFTYFAGFRVNSGEYKLMGLAPHGEPVYADLIRERLMDLRDDGSFRLDLRYFNYCQGSTMTNARFADLFGGRPRVPESAITQREMDLAASIQAVTEEVMVRCARQAHRRTGSTNLCLAGGVALNCVGNRRIVDEGPFERVWVQPAAGDAGGSLGVALLVWYQLLDHPRRPNPRDSQAGSLLGPRYSLSEVEAVLDGAGARYTVIRDEQELCDRTAGLLAAGKVVGWFQGRMEFGPRALGARSILADPRDPGMQALLNEKVKLRESFRPFAPSVMAEEAPGWFDTGRIAEDPYMVFVSPVSGAGPLPAVTHVDGTARLQTVDAERRPRFHRLLDAFRRATGCPVLVNTSFNVRGEPIVCTPADAYRCFLDTDIDALVLEDALVLKGDQPQLGEHRRVAQFALD